MVLAFRKIANACFSENSKRLLFLCNSQRFFFVADVAADVDVAAAVPVAVDVDVAVCFAVDVDCFS